MRKHFTDNLSRHPLYRTWAAMKDRCTNKNHRNFDIYGGNGVRVCDRWMRFKNFLEDMGEKPSPRHTLDRIDSKAEAAAKLAVAEHAALLTEAGLAA